MNSISKLLPPSNILLNVEATSKKRIFEQAGTLFELNQGITHGHVFESLFSRERLGSTGLGQGIAIPHGKIKGLHEAVGAVMRLTNPVAFDAPDGKPVQLLFFLLVPEHATEEHLQILSDLAEMFSDRKFRENLIRERDPSTIHQLITSWQPHAPDQRRQVV